MWAWTKYLYFVISTEIIPLVQTNTQHTERCICLFGCYGQSIIPCAKYHTTYILVLLLNLNMLTASKEQMDAGGHQLWPISQVTTLTIVTSRFKLHVYNPRSCSGSAGSCPFTFTPTSELGAKHDVITHIWLRTSRSTGKWSAVSCACLPRQGPLSKGRDLPLSATDLGDYWMISRHLK